MMEISRILLLLLVSVLHKAYGQDVLKDYVLTKKELSRCSLEDTGSLQGLRELRRKYSLEITKIDGLDVQLKASVKLGLICEQNLTSCFDSSLAEKSKCMSCSCPETKSNVTDVVMKRTDFIRCFGENDKLWPVLMGVKRNFDLTLINPPTEHIHFNAPETLGFACKQNFEHCKESVGPRNKSEKNGDDDDESKGIGKDDKDDIFDGESEENLESLSECMNCTCLGGKINTVKGING